MKKADNVISRRDTSARISQISALIMRTDRPCRSLPRANGDNVVSSVFCGFRGDFARRSALFDKISAA
ncbi:MAG: hypothetical protein IIZ73_05390 [Ruminococcus sp.]|nr:hypothetical protein [Ruminococcus sp.]